MFAKRNKRKPKQKKSAFQLILFPFLGIGVLSFFGFFYLHGSTFAIPLFELPVPTVQQVQQTAVPIPTSTLTSQVYTVSLPGIFQSGGYKASSQVSSPTPFVPLEPTATFPMPTLTPTSTPTPLPPTPTQTETEVAAARISDIYGVDPAMPLSCESSSAVDWARFFGVSINEYTFFNSLPKSDNPEKGFVGNVYGAWGQIPPAPYGVHAKPVARLLRDHGLPAKARTGMSFEELRNEIADGQPVIVWVIGGVWSGGNGVKYTSSDGETSTVASYQHTVIVIGYDPSYVTILDGSSVYLRSIDQFLSSWGTLGNQAIVYK